jgi:hypothetical protein
VTQQYEADGKPNEHQILFESLILAQDERWRRA